MRLPVVDGAIDRKAKFILIIHTQLSSTVQHMSSASGTIKILMISLRAEMVLKCSLSTFYGMRYFCQLLTILRIFRFDSKFSTLWLKLRLQDFDPIGNIILYYCRASPKVTSVLNSVNWIIVSVSRLNSLSAKCIASSAYSSCLLFKLDRPVQHHQPTDSEMFREIGDCPWKRSFAVN